MLMGLLVFHAPEFGHKLIVAQEGSDPGKMPQVQGLGEARTQPCCPSLSV